jgi:hypothetical protein
MKTQIPPLVATSVKEKDTLININAEPAKIKDSFSKNLIKPSSSL